MCGIVGIVSENSADFIKASNTKINHRGPDASGLFLEELVSLGHQRLSIQDLSPTGNQPMFSEDKNWVIVFNGEIYNHIEIRKKIEKKYNFQSTGDTETVLYGFVEYGIEVLNMLNGIFAFAIFNRKTKDLYVVRDQFGIKPLYIYTKDEKFLFSSEIKAIKDFPGIDKSIDYKALMNYIHYLWSPKTQTPFQHITKLEAGHYVYLNVDDFSTLKIKQYYDIPFNGQYLDKTEEELVDILEKKLIKAVDRQMLSDVPVGFFLSGGLDSSAIVALARKLHPNRKIRCYTIDTGMEAKIDGFVNDLHYAKIVAKHLDVDLEIVSAKSDIVKEFDSMVYHLDEPQADPAPLNVLNICRQARKNGDIVLLGGTAGDDLFSGYRRHQALKFELYKEYIPTFLRKLAYQFSKKLPLHNAQTRRIRKFLNKSHLPLIERLANYFAWLPEEINKNLFSENVKKQIGDYEPRSILLNALSAIPKEKELLNQMLYWEMKYFLTDHNLNYTDKLSMAVGVEVRVPFLDKELVEFSTQLPVHMKLKGNTVKYLLKKAMEKYLPHEVIYRPKTGFGAPVRQWITEELDEKIQDYLSKEMVEKRGVFNYEKVQELIESNKQLKIDASYSIWALLAIESWFRQFVD